MQTTILAVNLPNKVEEGLKDTLNDQNQEWISVKDCITAYQKFATHQVDLVLMDNQMPMVSGIELAQSMRANQGHEEIPIVIFSPEDEQNNLDRGAFGASMILPVSLPAKKIADSINELFEKKEELHVQTTTGKNMSSAIKHSTLEVFEMMAHMALTPGTFNIGDSATRQADVISSINLSGFISGTISTFMDTGFAMVLTQHLLEEDFDFQPTEEDVVDASGEVINMIAGGIKTCLCSSFSLFGISLPTVTIGKDTQRFCPTRNLCFTLPFTWTNHDFIVEFQLHPKAK